MKRYQLHKHICDPHAVIDKTHPFVHLDLSKSDCEVATFSIVDDADLLVECNERPISLYLLIGVGVKLKLQVIGPRQNSDWLLNIALEEGACSDIIMVDLASFKGTITINGELHGQDSRLQWHLASLSRQEDAKKYIVNFNHKATGTFADMRNFGVIEDKARLTFTGKSHIHRGASASATHQSARIMVFDPTCVGQADPILAIDDNNVAASHAATVGKINEEHMFYLKSRGINEANARRLITLGYLKPAIEQIHDERMKQRLYALLEERL
jgi:hypothetical protein